ncbi:unnamed protein product [Lactuca virosa]|uniref:Uncharacterized protein n=1 Tax=Lactuca virosa TaxID=75947 RepID=A0AAU9MNB9_9ASTR|nr:unnamed protein product [Lactuca virosa]
MSIPNPYGLYCIVELNYNSVFVRNPFSYANGFMYTIDDNHLSGLTYSEFVTWLQPFILDAYRTDGKIYVYVNQVGVEIVQWFGDELNEEDGHDSSIMGGDIEDELDNLMDVVVDSTSETVIMNKNIK